MTQTALHIAEPSRSSSCTFALLDAVAVAVAPRTIVATAINDQSTPLTVAPASEKITEKAEKRQDGVNVSAIVEAEEEKIRQKSRMLLNDINERQISRPALQKLVNDLAGG